MQVETQIKNHWPGKLFPPQQALLDQGYLETPENWLICAPTGSGKTLIGEWALLQSIEQGQRAAYVAPLKAIVEERHEDWSQRFTDVSVGLYTGETSRSPKHRTPKDESLLLFTPEKLLSYLQNWKKNLPWLSQIRTLVIDEFHMIGDSYRGPSVESLVSRLTRVNPFLRIIGLSGTLYNHKEISQWLRARTFVSEWRPIELQRSIVKFKKVSQKQELLLEEVLPVLKEGGKVLVFVNSRKRSESLATWLCDMKIDASFNHAGLPREKRTDIQHRLRGGEIDVVVSTSSLEMGVNFPVRKVVIFDSYGFNGETFAPITVERYLQMAGRAGRPGYDDTGEAVLFLPQWAGKDPDYDSAQLSPTRSGLFRKGALLREILYEVSGRLAISENHLHTNFADRSLWRPQGGKKSLTEEVNTLLKSDLLRAKEPERYYLSETALGRIASQMSVSPETVIFLGDIFRAFSYVTEFDLLLIVCLCPETSPKLGFNFEEIDALTDTLLSVPSEILNAPPEHLLELSRTIKPRTLLSALKCAVILHQHTQGASISDLAITYDSYPVDLDMLKRNTSWVLSVAQRVFTCHWINRIKADGMMPEPTDEAEERPPRPKCLHETLCRNLSIMVEYGIPAKAIGLARVESIGPKRASLLLNKGLSGPLDIINTPPETLGGILRFKPASVEKIVNSAKQIVLDDSIEDPFAIDEKLDIGSPTPCPTGIGNLSWPENIDPYRLRRALELKIDSKSLETVRISGGSEPHRIDISYNKKRKASYHCDCADFEKGTRQCKHILRTRLELRDDAEIIPLLRQLTQTEQRPLRYSVGELWMKEGGLYDAFHGREIDYSGKEFIARALAPNR